MDNVTKVSCFRWVENTYQFCKDFLKNYNLDSDEVYFFEVDLQCAEELHELHKYLPFLSKNDEKWKC